MNPEIARTADGSDTFFRRDLNQHYHSTFGAIRESEQVFIETGFRHAVEKFILPADNVDKHLDILEIGFGTGLNALLTLIEAEKAGISVKYTAIEAFPLEDEDRKSVV